MTQTPAHKWLYPKLTALIAEAERTGIARDVAVAVLTDLITGPEFNPILGTSPVSG
jgi:hypothetical protein